MIRLPRTLEAQSWDAASNARDTCIACGAQYDGDEEVCRNCGAGDNDEEGRHLDAQADKADADRDDKFDAECEAKK